MFSTVTSNYKKMLLVSNTFLVDAFNITLDSYEYFFFFQKMYLSYWKGRLKEKENISDQRYFSSAGSFFK